MLEVLKSAAFLGRRRHDVVVVCAGRVARTFVVAEREQLVLDHR